MRIIFSVTYANEVNKNLLKTNELLSKSTALEVKSDSGLTLTDQELDKTITDLSADVRLFIDQ